MECLSHGLKLVNLASRLSQIIKMMQRINRGGHVGTQLFWICELFIVKIRRKNTSCSSLLLSISLSQVQVQVQVQWAISNLTFDASSQQIIKKNVLSIIYRRNMTMNILRIALNLVLMSGACKALFVTHPRTTNNSVKHNSSRRMAATRHKHKSYLRFFRSPKILFYWIIWSFSCCRDPTRKTREWFPAIWRISFIILDRLCWHFYQL